MGMDDLIIYGIGNMAASYNVVACETYGKTTAIAEYACTPAQKLVDKALAKRIPHDMALLSCGVLQRAIECLDEAGRTRRATYKRVKLIETAVDACREPVASALRLGMLASPTDGRALLRLWTEVCEPHEKSRMTDMLRLDSTRTGV